MAEQEKYGKYPERIKTEDILEPKTRWICQRLDAIEEQLTALKTLLRDIRDRRR